METSGSRELGISFASGSKCNARGGNDEEFSMMGVTWSGLSQPHVTEQGFSKAAHPPTGGKVEEGNSDQGAVSTGWISCGS